MVGVPKSKGCKTCRRRKVRCDEARPTCGRCAKAGLKCEGYPNRLRWIDEVPRLVEQEKEPTGTTAVGLPSRTGFRAWAPVVEGLHYAPTTSHSWADVHLKFLYEHFQDGLDGYTYTSWIRDALREEALSAAQSSLAALAAAFFANKTGNDPEAMLNAGQLYGRALRKLNACLVDPKTSRSYSNVSAVFALYLYEIFASTQDFGWIHHAGGIGSLMEVLGPEYFADNPAHGLFLLARSTIIVRSYRLRQPCFLGEEAWRTIPWKHHPETNSGQHQMLSLIARIPSIHARCLEIDAAPEDEDPSILVQRMHQLKIDAVAVGKGIIDWRMVWEFNNPASAWEVRDLSPSIATGKDGSPLFGASLWFSSRERCVEILLYNCAMAAVLHFQRRFPPGVLMHELLQDWPESSYPPLTNALVLPSEAIHPSQCALEICKSVDFALSGRQDSARYLDLIMPLGICMTIFSIVGGYEEQFAWLAGFLKEVSQRTGVRTFHRMVRTAPSHTEFDPHISKYMSMEMLSDAAAIDSVKQDHELAIEE